MSYIKGELWGFDTIGIMDADGQHRTEDMARLLDFSRNHRKALSLGVRAVGKDMPLRSRMGNTIYHDEDNSCSHFRTVRDFFRIYREIMKFICSFKDHETTTENDYNLGRGDGII